MLLVPISQPFHLSEHWLTSDCQHLHLFAWELSPKLWKPLLGPAHLMGTCQSLTLCSWWINIPASFPGWDERALDDSDMCLCVWSVAQSCLTCGIFQARLLERGAISYSGYPPDAGSKPVSLGSPALAGGFFTTGATWDHCISGFTVALVPSHQYQLAW